MGVANPEFLSALAMPGDLPRALPEARISSLANGSALEDWPRCSRSLTVKEEWPRIKFGAPFRQLQQDGLVSGMRGGR